MDLLISKYLPVPHGFTTRHGGVSEGPFTSLNVGFSVGDDPAAVAENLRRLTNKANVAPSRFIGVSQVHGDVVLEAPERPASDVLAPPLGEADGVWTAAPETAVSVKTADCVPVLLVDPLGRRVAAIHSGWRGTDARISARAIEGWVKKGTSPGEVRAAIGPCIGACCYEVSADLAERFVQAFGAKAVRSGLKPHLDLVFAVKETLLQSGLREAHIDTETAVCTACPGSAFFSHRRDQGRTGRQVSFVVHRF